VAAVAPRHVATGVAAAALGAVGVHWLRELPWSLAAIVGAAIGFLAASSLLSVERLRGVWGGPSRRPPSNGD